VSISNLVNTDTPHTISTDQFEGQVVVNIKGFTDPQGRVLDSEYFQRPNRKDVTWSIQVQGRFLENHSADDILFGNTFDRPLKLPWGSGAALKFMNYVDPMLEHDLNSHTKPWALSPLISTMPHFSHSRLPWSPSSSRSSSCSRQGSAEPVSALDAGSPLFPPFPPKNSIEDDLTQIHHSQSLNVYDNDSASDLSLSSCSSSSSSSSSSRGAKTAVKYKLKNRKKPFVTGLRSFDLHTAKERQSYFRSTSHRKGVTFNADDVLTMDFCYGFLDFSPSLALRLPGGVSFDLIKYWDGQPVRFVCCERKRKPDHGVLSPGGDAEDPWGRMFWCIQIELADG
jgi:hypothetical protein